LADLVVVVALALFFALSAAFVKACDSIIGEQDVTQAVPIEAEEQAA
jgi:hypothetical protein